MKRCVSLCLLLLLVNKHHFLRDCGTRLKAIIIIADSVTGSATATATDLDRRGYERYRVRSRRRRRIERRKRATWQILNCQINQTALIYSISERITEGFEFRGSGYHTLGHKKEDLDRVNRTRYVREPQMIFTRQEGVLCGNKCF